MSLRWSAWVACGWPIFCGRCKSSPYYPLILMPSARRLSIMPEQQLPRHADVGYEPKDAKMAPMIVMGIVIILFGVVAHVVCYWLFDRYAATRRNQDQGRSPVAKQRLDFAK